MSKNKKYLNFTTYHAFYNSFMIDNMKSVYIEEVTGFGKMDLHLFIDLLTMADSEHFKIYLHFFYIITLFITLNFRFAFFSNLFLSHI